MNAETLLFLLTTVMELATLLCAWLGVRRARTDRKQALAIVGVPLLVNIILYAIYRTTPFFYLGVVLLICIPFVWPRKSA
ncbi:MAG: hypothetical protein IJ570_03480 [Prevotella sp.]|nr:hypothetical protein [Prevotella sp.]MBQ9656176.1 hypothetical protein [Prevotella sp.]MBR1414907.1 hypothetical protein [Prevotella sp.]